MIGRTVSHYQITAKLGAGGMGEVYLAEDTNLKRKVALKFLSEQFAGEQEALERFQREAEAIASLNHPAIVAVYDVAKHQGRPYIVMEYVAGQTLKDLIRAGDTDIERVIELAVQIGKGLAAAHEQNIVHRDIKPENVHLTPTGQVKIMDFGLATWRGATEVTKAGTALGTVKYMSPEQTTGAPLDRRTDLWALGAVLYELAGGRPPFQGDYDQAIIYSILNEDPLPLSEVRGDVPKALERAISKLLRKDQAHRYRSVEDFLADLEAIRLGSELKVAAGKPAPSIAVLPFANLSADPENEYFSDGLAEELINALTKISGLRVVARSSAFAFKGKDVDVRRIGRDLSVESVLEGSVRSSGKRIRVTAQLVKASDGYHLWSERYDREMADVFDIQDEITRAIVENLRVTLLGEDKDALERHRTENADALTLQLKGRYFWNKRTEEGIRTSIEYFEQAIAADPTYVMAHVGLADSYQSAGYFGYMPPMIAFPKSRDAAEAALALDDHSAAAHASLAYVMFYYDWDWNAADREFRRAIALEPGYAWAHMFYADYLTAMGRHDEAETQFIEGLKLDPLSLIANAGWGYLHCFRREPEKGIDWLGNTLAMDPGFVFARMWLSRAYEQVRQLVDAVKEGERAVAQDESNQWAVASLARAYAMAGTPDKARQLLTELDNTAKTRYVSSHGIALIHTALGNHDSAFTYLEKAIKERAVDLVYLRVDPRVDELRSDPRFEQVLSDAQHITAIGPNGSYKTQREIDS